jgi:hypothetical protein
MEVKLQDYLLREAEGVLVAIKQSKQISDESEKALREKLDAFVERHKQ